MRVGVKRLRPDAKLPVRATEGSAGWDLCAATDKTIIIGPSLGTRIPLGVALEMEPGWVGKLHLRSGVAAKKGLCLANGVGVVDSDYRGELAVAVWSLNRIADVTIEPGERIAQILFERSEAVEVEEVAELGVTERGAGGFGSTGK